MTETQHGDTCIRFGWVTLAVFALLGLGLESLHLLKAPLYMEVRIRRELWTLAHAHGVLLSLVTIVFGLFSNRIGSALTGASVALRTAVVFIPLGFLLGGIGNAETDPSLAIVLVPIGAVLVLYAAVAAARAAHRRQAPIASSATTNSRKKNGRSKRTGR